METPPLNSKFIDFFISENEEYIYYKLSTETNDALTKNRNVGNEKAEALIRAYKWICVSVVLLILFSISFGTYTWNSKLIRSNRMQEENNQQKPDSQPKTPEIPKEPVNKIPTPSSDKEFPGFDKVEYGEKPYGIRDPESPIIIIEEN